MNQTNAQKTPENKLPAKDAPGPKGVPMLGNILDIRRAGGLIQFYVDVNRQYGDIVRLQMGPMVSHLIVHPDYVRQVLLTNRQNYWKGVGMRKVKLVLGDGLFTSEGDLWQRHRKLMQPTFTPRGVAPFGPLMVEIIDRTLKRWDALARDEAIDINQEMMRLAMGVIAATMFNIDITRDAVEAAGAFTYVLDFISSHTMSMVDLPLWVPTPDNRRFNQATETLRQFMGNVIRSRREELERGQTGDRRPDLLDMLMTAKDEDTGQGMSDQQIYDEVLTIFFAGHETTAQALTWTWYLLSQHPEVEQKLHQEVDAGVAGASPTADALSGVTYARMVVDEAMRLYPPVWIYVRDAYGDDDIGGCRVPAKSMLMLSPYLTHRHPDFWENPEVFDPERFSPERAEKRHHYAYFPFGGGPRTCLGIHFALLEAQLAVTLVARRYRLRMATSEPVIPKMLGTLRPAGPVMMRLEPR